MVVILDSMLQAKHELQNPYGLEGDNQASIFGNDDWLFQFSLPQEPLDYLHDSSYFIIDSPGFSDRPQFNQILDIAGYMDRGILYHFWNDIKMMGNAGVQSREKDERARIKREFLEKEMMQRAKKEKRGKKMKRLEKLKDKVMSPQFGNKYKTSLRKNHQARR